MEDTNAMSEIVSHSPGPWTFKRCTLGHEDNWLNPIVGGITGHCGEGGRGYIARMFCQQSTMPGMVSAGPKTIEEAEANARSSGMNQVFYVNQLIDLIESKLLRTDDDKLTERLQVLHGLLDELLVAK